MQGVRLTQVVLQEPVSLLVMSAEGEFPGSHSSAILMSCCSLVSLSFQSAWLMLSGLLSLWTSSGFLRASVILCITEISVYLRHKRNISASCSACVLCFKSFDQEESPKANSLDGPH